MKFSVGGKNEFRGKPIPRYWNPAVFLGGAILGTLCVCLAAMAIAIIFLLIPFSPFFVVKMTRD